MIGKYGMCCLQNMVRHVELAIVWWGLNSYQLMFNHKQNFPAIRGPINTQKLHSRGWFLNLMWGSSLPYVVGGSPALLGLLTPHPLKGPMLEGHQSSIAWCKQTIVRVFRSCWQRLWAIVSC